MSWRTRLRTLSTRATDTDALWTYRYLRIGLVAVVAFLAVSVLQAWRSTGVLQTSISAFYYTTAHAAFLGALGAVGIGLIAYKGSTWTEDILLNSAGFLAFVVALVPTERPACATAPTDCGQWLPSFDDPTGGVTNNITALVIATLIGVACYVVIAAVDPAPVTARTPPKSPRTLWLWLARLLQFVVVLAALALHAVAPEKFNTWAHGAAATTMFVCIIAVVVHYAYYASSPRGRPTAFAKVYWLLAGIMTATLAAAVALHLSALLGADGHAADPTLSGWVLFVESILIAAFAVFWIIQTIDLWSDEDKYCHR